MNEMTESGPKAKGKGKGKGGKGAGGGANKTVEGQVARLLVRAIWLQEWADAHPDDPLEDRKPAWKEARSSVMEARLKGYVRAVSSLKRAGVTVAVSDAAAAEAEDGDDE